MHFGIFIPICLHMNCSLGYRLLFFLAVLMKASGFGRESHIMAVYFFLFLSGPKLYGVNGHIGRL